MAETRGWKRRNALVQLIIHEDSCIEIILGESKNEINHNFGFQLFT